MTLRHCIMWCTGVGFMLIAAFVALSNDPDAKAVCGFAAPGELARLNAIHCETATAKSTGLKP